MAGIPDIKVDLDELDIIITKLNVLKTELEEPITVLRTYCESRQDEIWVSRSSHNYWQLISAHKASIEKNRDSIEKLYNMVTAYKQRLIETSEQVMAEVMELHE